MKVISLKLDDEVTDEDFGLDVPGGTSVKDDSGTSFRLKQNQRFYPESIPNIIEVAEKRAVEPLADTFVPPPSKWYQKTWVYVVAVVVLLLGLVYVWRSRKITNTGTQTS